MSEAGEGPGAAAHTDYDAGPSVLILGDSKAAAERWRGPARLVGCRVVGALEIDDARDRLDGQAIADAVVVELDGCPDERLEETLRRLDAGACSGRFGSVVVAPLGLVDRIAAVTLHPGVHHLVAPADDFARVAALAQASARHLPRFHDAAKSPATARLQQLSEEIGRVATLLAAWSQDEATAAALVGGDCKEEAGEGAVDAAQIRAIIRARRLRDHFFRSELFADPAWDMLLDLMAARIERNRVAVSSLCIAAAVPPTTALRWIKTLCDQGIFVRIADPEDGRRVFIELADSSAAAMENYLRAAARISPLIV